MRYCGRRTELRGLCSAAKKRGERVGVVITTGGLHDAHRVLIKTIQEVCDFLVVACLPTNEQTYSFGEPVRTLSSDYAVCNSMGVDVIFAPTTVEWDNPAQRNEVAFVKVRREYSKVLCGATRMHLFSQTATACIRLFNMTQADVTVFGEKDYQQLLCVKGACQDLDIGVEFISVPTLRNESGLALASRNSTLSDDELQVSAAVYAAMSLVRDGLLSGRTDYAALEKEGEELIKATPGLTYDYLEVRRMDNLCRPEFTPDESLMIFCSTHCGSARLVDTLRVKEIKNDCSVSTL